ncbi:MAG: 16S rRNA (guanine(966)-N(2))-methyltransferase RsmD [Clostridia bacterium]|nr:16S rRNA (guanine(966)-N(2))-methyltransferase RsmD [Clostridia bacterium]
MRIITGTAKGKRLKTLEGDATRPTSERMKEAIFSAIQFDLEDRTVLDLFAGCGQLGLEALSRGAKSAMFVDASNDAITVIKQNAQATDFFSRSRFLTSDYRNYIRKAARRDSFDLVFIDPPYALGAVSDAIDRLVRADMLRRGAIIVAESGADAPFENHEELAALFTDIRHKTYGPSHIHIMTYAPQNQD